MDRQIPEKSHSVLISLNGSPFFNLELEVSKTRRQKVCVILILVTQVTKYLSYLKVYSVFGKLRQEHILGYMYH